MDKVEKKIVLGAFFHDIGKLVQRTRDKEVKKRVKKEYESWYQPVQRPGVRHEMWGAYYLKENGFEEIETIALRHHRPETMEEKIVHIADCLSAGERVELEKEETSAAEVPLTNLLNQVKLPELEESHVNISYFPLRPLDISKDCLPREREEALTEYSYKELELLLREEMKKAPPLGSDVFSFNKYFFLGFKYFSNVPSASYYHHPDISLFDHQKITACLSLCLYREIIGGHIPERILDTSISEIMSTRTKCTPFILAGGDLSGVQKFIYRLTHQGAARGLKGKSVYLELLTDVLARHIIDEFDLNEAHILYSGGGHFYIIMPQMYEEKLKQCFKEINEKLLKTHKGELSAVFATKKLSFSDFKKENFGTAWSTLHRRIAEEKQRKLSDFLHSHYEEIFTPPYGKKKSCPVCGKGALELVDDKCSWCRSFEELGTEARNAKFLSVEEVEKKKDEEVTSWQDIFTLFGYRYSFTKNNSSKGSSIYRLNDTNFEPDKEEGFKFLANRMAETGQGRIKDFDNLSKGAQGHKAWGVLKADVDNLGNIFKLGLGENQSLSRYSTLSRLVSIFFGGWVNKLVTEKFQEDIHVIYSGGDDLFVVGKWSSLPDFYGELIKDFKEYTGENPHISLSGGIFIAPAAKYPLFSAAKEAEMNLEKAKTYDRGYQKKNAFSFFGDTVGNEDLPELVELKDKLVSLLGKGVSRNLLHLIYSVAEKKIKIGEETISRVWRLIYVLTKLSERHKDCSEELKDLERKLITDTTSFNFLALIGARWAELLLRKE